MLWLTPEQLDEIRAHGTQGYPDEVCGLLVGSAYPSGSRIVHAVRRARNRNRERSGDRYDLDPVDLLRAERAADRLGRAIVGVYHSHPDHPARASETARASAVTVWGGGESWSYLIVSIERGVAVDARSWVLRDRVFEEEPVRLVGGPDAGRVAQEAHEGTPGPSAWAR